MLRTTEVKNPYGLMDMSKSEFYTLIEDGYKAIQEGRTRTMEEVRENLNKRRAERG